MAIIRQRLLTVTLGAVRASAPPARSPLRRRAV